MNEPVLRGVFLGAGHFAGIQLDAWRAVPGVKIAGIYNRTAEKARNLAELHGIDLVTDDVRLLLDQTKPDFVDICTAVDTHTSFARMAADRGIPILCQKPVAPTWEGTVNLIRYCKDRHVRLMVNENWRWQSWYREIKKLLGEGVLGEPFHTYCLMRPGDGWGDDPYPLQPYFRQMPQFLLMETGVHYFDTLRYLFGEIETVNCQTRRINPVIQGEDLAVVSMRFARGMTAVFDANRVSSTTETRTPVNGMMEIEGSKATLQLSPHGEIFIIPRNGTKYRHAYFMTEGYRGGGAVLAQRHFVQCLLDGSRFETEGEDYLQSVRCVYACYESARKQSVERVEER
jgi:predicted dehydrogenase